MENLNNGTSTLSQNRIAVTAIVIDNLSAAPAVNEVLSQYAAYIVGRMGLPYHTKGVSVISVVLDAPTECTNAMTGKLGMIKSVNAKTIFAKA